eukprot:TRINITY_DN15408_c0_g2_i1.p1 TRINITY_DN15408_c0_g2~~TRINITY_DN15408_c0_g2_i1.p1  ORF type:complete len:301 (-),score=75.91 TRINITY_DN15408_c0_g2_i1:221-1123(-)
MAVVVNSADEVAPIIGDVDAATPKAERFGSLFSSASTAACTTDMALASVSELAQESGDSTTAPTSRASSNPPRAQQDSSAAGQDDESQQRAASESEEKEEARVPSAALVPGAYDSPAAPDAAPATQATESDQKPAGDEGSAAVALEASPRRLRPPPVSTARDVAPEQVRPLSEALARAGLSQLPPPVVHAYRPVQVEPAPAVVPASFQGGRQLLGSSQLEAIWRDFNIQPPKTLSGGSAVVQSPPHSYGGQERRAAPKWDSDMAEIRKQFGIPEEMRVGRPADAGTAFTEGLVSVPPLEL